MTQNFVEVALEGLARLDEGNDPALPLGDITDPNRAFQTALLMCALWSTIQENGSTTFWAIREPELIDEHTIVLHGNPLEPVRDILDEALALAKQVKEKAAVTHGDRVIMLDVVDITFRVTIFLTEIDINAGSDIDALIARHDALNTDPIPTFFGDPPDGIAGASPVSIR